MVIGVDVPLFSMEAYQKIYGTMIYILYKVAEIYFINYSYLMR